MFFVDSPDFDPYAHKYLLILFASSRKFHTYTRRIERDRDRIKNACEPVCAFNIAQAHTIMKGNRSGAGYFFFLAPRSYQMIIVISVCVLVFSSVRLCKYNKFLLFCFSSSSSHSLEKNTILAIMLI